MAISTLTFTLSMGVGISASNSVTGAAASPTTNPTTFTKKISVGTSIANAGAGGGDEAAYVVVTIAASGSTTIDLTSVQNILQATAQNLARAKALTFQLLSTSDDSVNGTTCTYITLGNNGSNDFISSSSSGWLGTTASTFNLANGDFLCWGTPSATGAAVNATRKIIKIANNDGTNTAAVQYVIAGASS